MCAINGLRGLYKLDVHVYNADDIVTFDLLYILWNDAVHRKILL